MTKIYSRFDRPVSPGLEFVEPTLTQQHFKDECDINLLIKRAVATGDATLFTTTQRAEYYDTSSFDDFQQAQEYLADVRNDFSSLPSKVRRQFGDDPSRYVAFMSDATNYAKAVELGLLEGAEAANPKDLTVAASPPAGAPPEAPSGDGLGVKNP